MNRKITDVLCTVVTPDKLDWDTYLDDIQCTLNNSIIESTGELLRFLLYGYNRRILCNMLDDAIPPTCTYT